MGQSKFLNMRPGEGGLDISGDYKHPPYSPGILIWAMQGEVRLGKFFEKLIELRLLF